MKYTDEERYTVQRLATSIIKKFVANDRSGRLLYLFVCQLRNLSELKGFRSKDEYRFKVITKEEYEKLTNNLDSENTNDNLGWIKNITNNIE